jgi:gamma-glutamylcyclotransferase (GGCT)/AIG2-like uncharacterized protein YtfP
VPLYFAYGANMDREAMAVRCPGARPLGPARLARHRFIITRDGYASVLRDPRATVHGVLWDLVLSNIAALDKFEEVERGLYAKIGQPVIGEGGPRRALVYVATTAQVGAPRPGYLEGVLASAESWNLPVAYRQEIARYMHAGPGRSAPLATRKAVQPRAAAPSTTVGAATRASDAWSWEP